MIDETDPEGPKTYVSGSATLIQGFFCQHFWNFFVPIFYRFYTTFIQTNSVLNPDPHGSTLILSGCMHPDPDPGGQKRPTKIEKS
jgi:hypothetical protein